MDIVYTINCKGFMNIYANIKARNLKSFRILLITPLKLKSQAKSFEALKYPGLQSVQVS